MKNYALVTGATSGIGYEFAKLCAKDGYNLIIVARNQTKLNEIKTEFEKQFKISVLLIEKDLSKPGAAAELYKFLIENKIELKVLINNAGFGLFGKYYETDSAKESEMIQLNIVALTELTKLIVKEMVKQKSGYILNVASVAGFQPGPLMSVYYATKAYVLSFSQAIACELKDKGVVVSVLCPGATESNFFNAASMEESKLVKGKKLPTSKEVAEYGYKSLFEQKTVAVHGFQNKFLVFMGRLLPRKLLANIVNKIQEK